MTAVAAEEAVMTAVLYISITCFISYFCVLMVQQYLARCRGAAMCQA
jgi:hypothetical protein